MCTNKKKTATKNFVWVRHTYISRPDKTLIIEMKKKVILISVNFFAIYKYNIHTTVFHSKQTCFWVQQHFVYIYMKKFGSNLSK